MVFKQIFTAFFISFIFSVVIFAENKGNNDSSFVAAFCKYKPALLKTINYGDNEPFQLDLRANTETITPRAYLLKAILSSADKPCPDTLNTSLLVKGMEHVLYNQFDTYDRFITDTATGIMLAKALAVNKSSRALAQSFIEICKDDLHPMLLKSLSDTLKENFSRSPYFNLTDSLQFLPLLDLDSIERSYLKGQLKHEVLFVNAMFKDSVAIDSLIKEFKRATKYGYKKDYARQLGFVGTRECAIALLSELNSDVVIIRPHYSGPHYSPSPSDATDHVSIRRAILKALGHIHPDNPLFISELLGEGEYIYCLKKAGKYPQDRVKRRMVGLFRSIPLTSKDSLVIPEYFQKVIHWADSAYGIKFPPEAENWFFNKTVAKKNDRSIFEKQINSKQSQGSSPKLSKPQ